MNVEVLGNRFYTGIEQYAYHLAHQLSAGKLDFTLLVPPGIAKSVFPRHASLVYHRPKAIFGSHLLSAVLFPPKGLQQFDLIHSPTVTAPFFFRPQSRVVMTVHDLTPLLFPELQTSRSTLYFRYLLKHRIRYVDRFIAVSRSTKEDLKRLFKIPDSQIDVVYSGVATHFKPSASMREDFLLAVGTLEPRKNLRRLICAYVELRREGKIRGKLVLVGKKGWQYDDILGVPEPYKGDIIFKGYVPDKDLVRLYQTAGFFVYPSVYEGFGLPILEAMACGCPVITSHTSSMPEVADGAALLVDPYDTEGLKNAIDTLAHSETLRADMGMAGIRRASSFSWQACADQTLQVYQRELGS